MHFPPLESMPNELIENCLNIVSQIKYMVEASLDYFNLHGSTCLINKNTAIEITTGNLAILRNSYLDNS